MKRKISLFEVFYITTLKILGFINSHIVELKISNHRNLIICYHSIESKEDWRFETSIINFKEQVKRLNKKFKIVPLSELINDSNVSNRPRASITFDDGYENVYLNALPILSKLGLTGTMFIIGDSKMAVRSELGNKKKLLSTFQINNLVENGWEIGFHSLTHSNFSKLTNKQLRYEVYLGKNKTEKKLGIKLKYFSFPRGFYNTQIIKSVSDSGFAKGFTVEGSESSSKIDFLVPRVSIEGRLSDDDFGALISDLGSIFHNFAMKLINIKSSIFK